jgi:hypothetical protein
MTLPGLPLGPGGGRPIDLDIDIDGGDYLDVEVEKEED